MNPIEKEGGGGYLGEVTEGQWAGWHHWMPGDPFEDHVGPFYIRRDDDGILCAFDPGLHCRNGYGMIHGGALMTFADFALFMIPCHEGEPVHGVTVTMNCEFVASAPAGVRLLARGETVRAGRSLVFVRGSITSEGRTVLTFSGTIKRTGKG